MNIVAEYLPLLFQPGDRIDLVYIHQNKSEGQNVYDFLMPIEQACLDSTFDNIRENQERGFNSYVCMAALGDGDSRKKANIKTIRNAFLDFDKNAKAGLDKIAEDVKAGLVPAPTVILESSPGKYYTIWAVEGFDVEMVEKLNKVLCQRYGADSNATDASRVLRLPGTVNLKYESKPVVRLVATAPGRNTPSAFKIELEPKAKTEVVKTASVTSAGLEENDPEPFKPEPRLDDGIKIEEGHRNNAVSRFCWWEWVRRKHGEEETQENVHAYNESHCQPPLPSSEVEDVINHKLGLKQIGSGVEWKSDCKAAQPESDDVEVQESKRSFQDQINQLQEDGKTDQIQELWNKMMMENQAKTASAEKAQSEDVKDNWLSKFRSVDEMETGEIVMVIDGVLQEGTCFLGAVPGDCKTLVALSMAKAISTGQPLFGQSQFRVKQSRSVIYLIPETRDRAFRKRCENFRLPYDKTKFMARTISMGLPLDLQDPHLLEACRQLHPVVFLDTAVRFNKSDNQNDAAKNQMLVNDVVALLAAGAVTVVLLHHATKASKKEKMDLQNMLSGTGDFAAMCDQAYGLQVDAKLYDFKRGPLELWMVSLKDREEQGTLNLIRLAASHKVEGAMTPVSYINEKGDFHVVDNAAEFQNSVQKLLSLVKAYPDSTLAELNEETGLTEVRIRWTLHGYGWHTVAGGKNGSSPWHQDGDKPCPYAKPEKPSVTVQDAVRFLEGALSLGETPEADILTQADKVGLTDGLLAKARKRLSVVVRDGVWALPEPKAEPGAEEPTEPNKGGRPKDKDALTSTERSRITRARKRQAKQAETVEPTKV